MMRKEEITGKRKLEAMLFFIGLVCFAAIMLLIASHNMREHHEDLMSRADYLIAKSEASLERWDHGNSLR